MTTVQNIILNNKQYTVKTYADGSVYITVSYDAIVPSTAYSAYPSYTRRVSSVSAFGATGKKVLKALAKV